MFTNNKKNVKNGLTLIEILVVIMITGLLVSIVIVCALGVQALEFISLNNYVVASLREVLSSLSLLFIPSTIVAALKTVFSIAKI